MSELAAEAISRMEYFTMEVREGRGGEVMPGYAKSIFTTSEVNLNYKVRKVIGRGVPRTLKTSNESLSLSRRQPAAELIEKREIGKYEDRLRPPWPPAPRKVQPCRRKKREGGESPPLKG